MKNINTRVCPVALSGSLDNSIRRWLQNPEKILRPFKGGVIGSEPMTESLGL